MHNSIVLVDEEENNHAKNSIFTQKNLFNGLNKQRVKEEDDLEYTAS